MMRLQRNHSQILDDQIRGNRASLTAPGFCILCRTRLPLFVTDELLDELVESLYPDVAYHLDVCEDCLEEYMALTTLLHAAVLGEKDA
jgi:hypothetical protein